MRILLISSMRYAIRIYQVFAMKYIHIFADVAISIVIAMQKRITFIPNSMADDIKVLFKKYAYNKPKYEQTFESISFHQ